MIERGIQWMQRDDDDDDDDPALLLFLPVQMLQQK